MEKSKRFPLQPQTTLELVDRTFRIYRDNFMTFLVPVALVTVPTTIITVIGSLLYTARAAELQPLLNDLQRQSTRNMTPAMQAEAMRAAGEIISVALIFLTIFAITTLLQVVLVHGIITQLASESNLGYRSTASEAFRAVRDRLFPLTGAVILEFIILVIIILIISIMTVFVPICGLLFLLLFYIYLAMFSLLTPTVVLERTGIGLAMRRSWSLGKARIFQILGITVAVGIINYVITFGLGVLLGIFAPDTASVSVDGSDIINVVVQSIINVFITPIIPIAFTLLYYDARVRLEGLDIALQNSEVAEPRPADIESPQPTDSLVSGKDFGNMVVIAIVLVGIGGLLVCGLTALLGPSLSGLR